MQGGTGEADDPQPNLVRAWSPTLVPEGQPDLVRILCRQAMKVESREQAHDAVGNLFADFGQRVVFGDVCTGRTVEPSTGAFEQPGLHRFPQVDTVEPLRRQVA